MDEENRRDQVTGENADGLTNDPAAGKRMDDAQNASMHADDGQNPSVNAGDVQNASVHTDETQNASVHAASETGAEDTASGQQADSPVSHDNSSYTMSGDPAYRYSYTPQQDQNHTYGQNDQQNAGGCYGQNSQQNAGNSYNYGQSNQQNAGSSYGQSNQQNAGSSYDPYNQQNTGSSYGQNSQQNAGNSYNYGPQNPQYGQGGSNGRGDDWRNDPNLNPREKPKTKKSIGRKIAATAAVILGVLVLVGGAWIGISKGIRTLRGGNNTSAVAAADNTTDNTTLKAGESAAASDTKKIGSTAVLSNVSSDTQTVATVAANAMPSIVAITSQLTETGYDVFGQAYSQDATGAGSGILIEQTDSSLLIATNYHVVEGAKSISVTFADEKQASGTVKGYNATADLAVVVVSLKDVSDSTLKAIKIATLGDSDSVKVGEQVVAIGNALGYGQSVTVGYISATNRQVQLDSKTMTLLQTDAAINPGNSGGALLNLKGEVIGINSVKYASEEVEGIGYAIPISNAQPIITELKNKETLTSAEQGYLGITGTDVTAEVAKMYSMPEGAYVYSVTSGGAAEKAGIQKGDIITKVNGIEVSTMATLRTEINSYRVGTEVTLTIERSENGNYVEKEIKVKLTNAKTAGATTSDNSTDSSSGSSNGSSSGSDSGSNGSSGGSYSINPFSGNGSGSGSSNGSSSGGSSGLN